VAILQGDQPTLQALVGRVFLVLFWSTAAARIEVYSRLVRVR
jgi:hypothetical protein